MLIIRKVLTVIFKKARNCLRDHAVMTSNPDSFSRSLKINTIVSISGYIDGSPILRLRLSSNSMEHK